MEQPRPVPVPGMGSEDAARNIELLQHNLPAGGGWWMRGMRELSAGGRAGDLSVVAGAGARSETRITRDTNIVDRPFRSVDVEEDALGRSQAPASEGGANEGLQSDIREEAFSVRSEGLQRQRSHPASDVQRPASTVGRPSREFTGNVNEEEASMLAMRLTGLRESVVPHSLPVNETLSPIALPFLRPWNPAAAGLDDVFLGDNHIIIQFRLCILCTFNQRVSLHLITSSKPIHHNTNTTNTHTHTQAAILAS